VETHLVNSQLLSKKDVRVWFWAGDSEFAGDCKAVADNGLMFHARMKMAGGSTIADVTRYLDGIRKKLVGKPMAVELSSPRTKGEVRLKVERVDLVSSAKKVFAFIATYASPPDPRFMKLLLEPVVLKAPKKP
jgi:hypothetical protein